MVCMSQRVGSMKEITKSCFKEEYGHCLKVLETLKIFNILLSLYLDPAEEISLRNCECKHFSN